jgi:hypothetical protein
MYNKTIFSRTILHSVIRLNKQRINHCDRVFFYENVKFKMLYSLLAPPWCPESAVIVRS